jgi:FkbM family methyltransferase
MKIRLALFKRLPFLVAVRISLAVLFKKLIQKELNFYFSQFDEDIVLKHLLRGKQAGIYVDVGCNDPILLSNTFFLYLNGWKGVCIDANEKLCKKFSKIRPLDTVVLSAVSDVEKEVVFYVSDSAPAASTIDQEQLLEWKKHWEFNREVKMKTRRLEEILDQHLPMASEIDVLSIDVEGHDLNVLKSINLAKYRPVFIVIELHDFNLANRGSNAVVDYLAENEYELYYYSIINGYFRDKRSPMPLPFP